MLLGWWPPQHLEVLTYAYLHLLKISLNLPVDVSCVSLPLQPLPVPNPPALQVVLPRFSNTYLVWRDPEPFVGDILGVQIRYLIDCVPQNIPELGRGIKHYSVSGIKNSVGKTHSISLRARTSAGCGSFSAPEVFTFQPIGKASDVPKNNLFCCPLFILPVYN